MTNALGGFLRGHALAWLAACLVALSPTLPAGAQAPSPDPTRLALVGVTSGIAPEEILSEDDLKLLLACRRPVTLGQVLAQGVAFRSSRIADLQDEGLLVQRGDRFLSSLPILTEDGADPLGEMLDELAAPIVSAIAGDFRAMQADLRTDGLGAAMPALAQWIVYERAWAHLIDSGMIDVQGLVSRQREAYPDRAWWGVLWYRADRDGFSQSVASVTARDRTMLVAWDPADGPPEIDHENPYAWMSRIANAVRNDRLEVRDPEDFPELARERLLRDDEDDDEALRAPLLEWDLDEEEGWARSVRAATEVLAVTVTAQLSGSWLSRLADAGLGTLVEADPVVARTIAYHGLVPRILAGLEEEGVGALLGASSGRVSLLFWKDLPVEMRRPTLPLR